MPSGTEILHELFVSRETSETVLRWWQEGVPGPCRLNVRPLISGRDYHALHRENPACNLASAVNGASVSWRPYASLPRIGAVLTVINTPSLTGTAIFYTQPKEIVASIASRTLPHLAASRSTSSRVPRS